MVGGEKPRRPDFLQQDVRPLPGVRNVCDAWDLPEHTGEGAVDEMYTRHMFEHLTFAQGRRCARAWFRALRRGGTLEILLPNLHFHVCQLYLQRNIEGTLPKAGWKKHAVASLFGWQRGEEDELWDVHKSGYDAAMLEKEFGDAGFVVRQRRCKAMSRDLHYVFAKP